MKQFAHLHLVQKIYVKTTVIIIKLILYITLFRTVEEIGLIVYRAPVESMVINLRMF